MKRILFILSVLTLMVSACATKSTTTPGDTLLVSQGDVEKSYKLADLQALEAVQETFKDVTYIGVPLTVLLADAGFNPAGLSAVKAVASDGYSVNYDPALFNLPDTMLAYARADGPLTDTEAPFTMVLPGQEGKMNPRMVVKIIALP
jgi:hypothetical protein